MLSVESIVEVSRFMDLFAYSNMRLKRLRVFTKSVDYSDLIIQRGR